MAKASKADAEKLAALSSDCSFLLSHLIRQNGDNSKTNQQAYDILRLILDLDNLNPTPLLKSSKVGWYSALDNPRVFDPSSKYFSCPENIKAVCFTDSTLAGLRAHREVFDIKYGIAFDRDYLFKQGANPCLNIRESLFKSKIDNSKDSYDKLFNYIPADLAGYINIINESFDATHEREWRYIGDLKFEHSHIKFLFCPEEQFEIFSAIQLNGKPALFDLNWLDRI